MRFIGRSVVNMYCLTTVNGTGSDKTEADSMEKIKLECKDQEVALSAVPMIVELPVAARSHAEHHKATTIEEHVSHYAVPREGASLESLEIDTGSDRLTGEQTPLLEGDKRIDEPCGIPDRRGAESGMEEIGPSRSACLTMSLALYPTREAENESSDLADSESFASTVGLTQVGWDQLKVSGLSYIRQRQQQTLIKQAQTQNADHPETPKEILPQTPIRVARPPGEGRGRNQLLPRYWPRITDQELQQITSGEYPLVIL